MKKNIYEIREMYRELTKTKETLYKWQKRIKLAELCMGSAWCIPSVMLVQDQLAGYRKEYPVALVEELNREKK